MRRFAALLVVAAGCSAPGGGVSESNLRATVEKLVSFGTRNSLSTKGIGEASAWLKAEFGKLPNLKVEFHEFTDERLKRNGELVPQRNVIATLRGKTRPDEIVVFGAHYDSLNLTEKGNPDAIAPGANDNATGTAGVLEAARILSQTEHDRTIIFACFSAEEQGLIGAWHFAKSLKDAGVNVVAMLNNDIIGGAKDEEGKPLNDRRLRCFSAGPQDSDSRRLARLADFILERKEKALQLDVQDAVDRPKRAGDHKSFNAHGFAAIRFIEGCETDWIHHTAKDVIDRIHFPYCARVVAADIVVLSNLASAPPAPSTPKAEGGRVTWDPVEGAVRYLVASRGTGTFFESYLEVDRPEAAVKLQVTSTATVCVAAIDARGFVSLFSSEVAIK